MQDIVVLDGIEDFPMGVGHWPKLFVSIPCGAIFMIVGELAEA